MTSKIICLILITSNLLLYKSNAQNSYGLFDGRERDVRCQDCKLLTEKKPKEVLFGIHFEEGNVYFSMTSEAWFNRFFSKPTDGITVDIVSKDQFGCSKSITTSAFPLGMFLKPMYLAELKKNLRTEYNGWISIKIGSIPSELKGKEIEGNLVILRYGAICYYTNFISLNRSLWNLLDMGLYTDSLVRLDKTETESNSKSQYFSYTRKMTVVIPFAKGKVEVAEKEVKPLYDSLSLSGYSIRKIDIRSFSSVEGAYDVNVRLQQARAGKIANIIQRYQNRKIKTDITSGENWIEFMRDIRNTEYDSLAEQTKTLIKKNLTDKRLLSKIEPLLSKHRKVIITLYADVRSLADDMPAATIVDSFQKAISRKEIDKAIIIQRSIFERVRDQSLPSSYFHNLEIPTEKQFSRLLNDREVYRYLLEEIYEDEALENLLKLEIVDADNNKVKYNIAALGLTIGQFNDSIVKNLHLLTRISNLLKLGIDSMLVKRMLINYHIISAEVFMKNEQYGDKDKEIFTVKKNYVDKNLTDRDLLSLGKYFAYYGLYDWADEIIEPRLGQLEVDEDLLFFYINLSFFTGKDFSEGKMYEMLLNAISINNKRFCRFFNATNKGGISMQLLLEEFWKSMYCENCNGKTLLNLYSKR